MDRTKKDELVASVIKHLSEGDNPDDIILELCNRNGYSWSQAEKLVSEVQTKEGSTIAKRQLPLMYISAFFILAAGIILMGIGLYSILESIIQHEGLFPPDIYYYMIHGYDKGNFPFTALQPAVYPYIKWIVTFFFSPFSMIFFGFLMILGSLFGMRDIWSNILNR